MTSGYKINAEADRSPRILIAPLDWGLGHATRCIPIIKLLISRGCRVILAAKGKQAELLAKEFPNMELLPLSGYNLRYGRQGWSTVGNIFFQLPKILISVKREKRWLDTLLKKRPVDAVISDCRFGLHNKDVFCVLLTHQLTIRSPFGKWTERLLQRWNYSFINRFNECWIPDYESKPGLAGELSHPATFPEVPVKYIGGISRLDACVQNTQMVQYDLLVIVSGPEPQRSIFENAVLNDLKNYEGNVAIVRGLPGSHQNISHNGAAIFNHVTADELCVLMMNSALIISRSGYTTVMDVVRLRKKSVLVPTPGQSEQEYLGAFLMQRQLCVCMKQQEFSLKKAVAAAASFQYADMSGFDMELYKSLIDVNVLRVMKL